MSDNNNNLWRWRHEHKQPHHERQKQFYIYVMVASYTHLHKVEGLNKWICHLIDIQHKIQVTLLWSRKQEGHKYVNESLVQQCYAEGHRLKHDLSTSEGNAASEKETTATVSTWPLKMSFIQIDPQWRVTCHVTKHSPPWDDSANNAGITRSQRIKVRNQDGQKSQTNQNEGRIKYFIIRFHHSES